MAFPLAFGLSSTVAARAYGHRYCEQGCTVLQALEALGQSLESHFHTLLPGLVRLLPVVNQSMTPVQTKRRILATLSTLLPRMRLAPYASTIIHPLIRTISLSRVPDVRMDAINTICDISVAIGPSLSLFVPTIQSVLSQMKVPQPERWRNIMCTLAKNEAPCITDVESRWDDANGWAPEMDNILYRMPLGDVPENPPAALLRGAFPILPNPQRNFSIVSFSFLASRPDMAHRLLA